MTLRVGSTVQLKSGGQKMTIEVLNEKNAVCVWTDKGKFCREVIILGALKEDTVMEGILKAVEGKGDDGVS